MNVGKHYFSQYTKHLSIPSEALTNIDNYDKLCEACG